MISNHDMEAMREQLANIRADLAARQAQKAAHKAVQDWGQGTPPEIALKRLNEALKGRGVK